MDTSIQRKYFNNKNFVIYSNPENIQHTNKLTNIIGSNNHWWKAKISKSYRVVQCHTDRILCVIYPYNDIACSWIGKVVRGSIAICRILYGVHFKGCLCMTVERRCLWKQCLYMYMTGKESRREREEEKQRKRGEEGKKERELEVSCGKWQCRSCRK